MSTTETATANCARCQALPNRLPQTGALYFSSNLGVTRATVRNWLLSQGIPCEEASAGTLYVPLVAGRLLHLGEGFPGLLQGDELTEARFLLLPNPAELTAADLVRLRPLTALVNAVQGEWLMEVLSEGRLITHFHPIVDAREPSEVYAYECLLRGHDQDGNLISPSRLFAAARSADMLFHLDRQARLTAIRSAIEHKVQRRLFINFNPAAIYNPNACLKTTVAAAKEAKLPPSHFVFEVVESEQIRDSDHLLRILTVYREAGFRVALDDVGAGYSSLNLLTRLRPDYIKLDMELVRGVDQDPYKAQVLGKLLEMAQGLGVQTVVEGVETEGEWIWSRDHGASFVQGFLFAKPASPPPEPHAALPV